MKSRTQLAYDTGGRPWHHPSSSQAPVLERLRKAAGLSQVALAQKAGVSHYTIHRIENNLVTPKQATLQKLATALGVTVDVLGGTL
jgi:transcriptional regulator with XRE-family HTH domain